MNYQQSFLKNINNNKTDLNFIDYRCIDPLATVMESPWFPMRDVCPCDPKLSNPTGRGYTGCPFGVSFNNENQNQNNNLEKLQTISNVNTQWLPQEVSSLPTGAIYPKNSYTAPQLQPRQLYRIGVSWRQ